MLLADEVKIRPTVAFSGGVLRTTSLLRIMMKCFCRGPNMTVSVTSVHKITTDFLFEVVKNAATAVEQSRSIVLACITGNHKINQLYYKLFDRPSETEYPVTVTHPLDDTRKWYLLYDILHLLKCIRNKHPPSMGKVVSSV